MQEHKPKSPRLEWIADALMDEIEKPDKEIDWEYVELCEKLLSSFTEQKKHSKWEVRKRLKHLFRSAKKESSVPIVNKSKPVLHKIKPAFVALIAAIVLMFSCVTICATTPVREYILKALTLNNNQSVTENGVTYTYAGKSTIYNDIVDLCLHENIQICFPQYLPYNAQITGITTFEANDTVIFTINDQRINFIIINNYNDISHTDTTETLDWKGYTFYILNQHDRVVSYSIIKNNLYTISCDSKDQLYDIIYSLNFERIK